MFADHQPRVHEHCFASTYPTNQPFSNIMLYCECLTVICAAYVFLLIERHCWRNWRHWRNTYFLNEGTWYGENLVADLNLQDGADFRNFVRMTPYDFETSLQIIRCKISWTDLQYWAVIPPSIQLAVMLRYLASGKSFTSLMYTFKISKQSISAIIPEVCEAVINALKPYIKVRNCNHFYSVCCILWDTAREFVKLILVQCENELITGLQRAF
jgi:hypothetical protein